jgi:hypothetical protein
MKRRIAIWLVTLMAVAMGSLLAFVSFQPAQIRHARMQNVPEQAFSGNPSPAMTGILSNTNFQLALRALQQRTGAQQLAEPSVTTHYWGAGHLNRAYYDMSFTLPVTNR